MSSVNDENNSSREGLKEVLVRKLGIFELRALARELGISSPTTKRRNDLVELILNQRSKIQSGELSNLNFGKKGRPYKKLGSIDEILNVVTFDSDTLPNRIQKSAPSYDDLICFAQEMPTFDLTTKEYKTLTGVVRTAGSTNFFIDNIDGIKVFVPDDKVEQLNITQGDLIKGKCAKINSQGQYILLDIFEINCENIDKYQVKSYDLGRPIISKEKLPFGRGMLACGRRNACEYHSDVFEDDKFEELAKDCKERNIKVVVLGLNISFENDILYKSLDNVIAQTTPYGSHCAAGLDRVVDTIALCQKLIQRGNKVLLFINDIVEILRTLDKYYGGADQGDGHSIESVVVAQKLLSIGRAFDSGLWTTLLVVYRDSDIYDTFLNNELFKVSAKVE